MTMPAPVARPRPFVPVLREGDAVPSAGLRDERGRPFSFATANGRTAVVSFIYTRCRDSTMCPLVAAKFARMQRELHGAPIRLVTITVDPAHDTPEVLARYGASYGADQGVWTFVTGPGAAIDDIAGRLGIVLERPRPGVIVHSEAAVIIDARGRIARFLDGAAWLQDASALCGGRGATPLTVGAGLTLLVAVTVVLTAVFARAFRTIRLPREQR